MPCYKSSHPPVVESLAETLLRQQNRKRIRETFRAGTKVRIRGEVEPKWHGKLGVIKAVDVVPQHTFSGTNMTMSLIRFTVSVDGTDLTIYQQDALEKVEG